MSDKRKDNKGRVLQKGESQRKDLTYQFRFTDLNGDRKTVYSQDLQGLRKKEEQIRKKLNSGSDPFAGAKVSVTEQVQRYLDLKQNIKRSTIKTYRTRFNALKKDEFGNRTIESVKRSDAQAWVIRLHNEGFSYSYIRSIKSLVESAFELACDDEILTKNPFTFKLSSYIKNNKQDREALTEHQQEMLLQFIDETYKDKKYYHMFVVLLGTGLRVSEFCGLTRKDLDFKNRKISVNHQIILSKEKDAPRYYIEETKTKSGIRSIPMTDAVYKSLMDELKNRTNSRMPRIVDGYSDFVFLTRYGNPYTSDLICERVKKVTESFSEKCPNEPMPYITPHVLRHTFCTNMANSGINIKSLQYLMGHSDASITLNLYTHASYEQAEMEMLEKVR